MFIAISLQETLQDTRGPRIFCGEDLFDSSLVSNNRENEIENLQDSYTNVIDIHTDISSSIAYIAQNDDVRFNTSLSNTIVDDKLEVYKVLCKIANFQQSVQYRAASYWIYNKFTDMRENNKISICDLLLRTIDTDKYNIRILLSLLIATYPFRNKLNYRAEFYSKVETLVYMQYPKDEVRQILGNLGK